MSRAKLTQWFPADVKPVHGGVYETRRTTTFGSVKVQPARWDAKRKLWMIGRNEARLAATQRVPSNHQAREWRGLAADPALVHRTAFLEAKAEDRRPGLPAMVDYVHRAFYSRNPRLQREAAAHAKNLWHLAHPKVAA